MVTTPRKTPRAASTSKPTAAAAKVTPENAAPDATPADANARPPMQELPLSEREEMKKKELIDLVVERSGIKKRDAKPAIEAALAILGETLAEGREVNMRPMGKIKVTRMKKGANGQVIHARIRQPEPGEKADPDPEMTDPIVQAAE